NDRSANLSDKTSCRVRGYSVQPGSRRGSGGVGRAVGVRELDRRLDRGPAQAGPRGAVGTGDEDHRALGGRGVRGGSVDRRGGDRSAGPGGPAPWWRAQERGGAPAHRRGRDGPLLQPGADRAAGGAASGRTVGGTEGRGTTPDADAG